MKTFGAVAALGALIVLPLFGTAAPSATAPAPNPTATPALPCGYVSFIPAGAPRFANGTAYERLKATVTFADGHTETAEFPYLWIYPNGEETDPWSSTNLRRADFSITMQLPPPGTDATTFPPLIRYVLKHSAANGYTDLPACKGAQGAPTQPVFDAAAEYARVMATVRQPVLLTMVDDSARDVPIKIVDATMYTPGDTGHESPVVARDCVTFWNRSPKIVTAIRFSFTHFDAAGELKLIHSLDRAGFFKPGVVVEGARRAAPDSRTDALKLKNCRSFLWSGIAGANRVAVTSVEFDDGSTWAPATRIASPEPRR